MASAIRLGMGRHVLTVGREKAIRVAKMIYIFEVFFPACCLLSKLAILLLYNTLFGTKQNRKFVNALRVLAGAWISLSVVALFCIALQCWPVHLAWDSDHTQNCLDLSKMIFTLTLLTSICNIATLVLPLPLVWKLKLSVRKKIGVAMLFILGGG